MKITWLARAALIALAALTACDKTVDSALNDTGKQTESLAYTELRPPSTLPAVGSVVLVRSAQPFELQVICHAGDVVGTHGGQFGSSNTVSSSWNTSNGGKGSLGVSVVNQLNATLGGEYVRKVDYSMSNARLVEMSDSDLEAALNDHTLTDVCRRVINNRLSSGSQLTLVQASLIADVTYNLDFDSSVSADAKIAAVGKLAPSLNASITNATAGQLAGQALIWGIRDDKTLLLRLVNDNAEESAPAGPPERILPPVTASVSE